MTHCLLPAGLTHQRCPSYVSADQLSSVSLRSGTCELARLKHHRPCLDLSILNTTSLFSPAAGLPSLLGLSEPSSRAGIVCPPPCTLISSLQFLWGPQALGERGARAKTLATDLACHLPPRAVGRLALSSLWLVERQERSFFRSLRIGNTRAQYRSASSLFFATASSRASLISTTNRIRALAAASASLVRAAMAPLTLCHGRVDVQSESTSGPSSSQ
jgi:hypothetical protein